MAISVSQSTTLVQTLKTIKWIAMELYKDIYGPQRINPNNFGDPLTFSLESLEGWHL